MKRHVTRLLAAFLAGYAQSKPSDLPPPLPPGPQIPQQRPPSEDNDYSGLTGVQLAELCCFAALLNDDRVLARKVDDWAASESGR